LVPHSKKKKKKKMKKTKKKKKKKKKKTKSVKIVLSSEVKIKFLNFVTRTHMSRYLYGFPFSRARC
jgi:hypothetical protein